MTKALIVIPYVHKPYFDKCMATLDPFLDVLPIDNTKRNLGVAESWNRGIDAVKEDSSYDWLVVCSAAMRFGSSMGNDMIRQLDAHLGDNVIRFAEDWIKEQEFERGKNPSWYEGVFYWHCTALSRVTLGAVGYFDPNFYPIYFEDTDYDLRIKKTGIYGTDIILPIDAVSKSIGHSIELAGVKSPSEPLVAYFAEKWGRHPGAPQLGSYDRPFNDPNNSLAYFPPAHGRAWNE